MSPNDSTSRECAGEVAALPGDRQAEHHGQHRRVGAPRERPVVVDLGEPASRRLDVAGDEGQLRLPQRHVPGVERVADGRRPARAKAPCPPRRPRRRPARAGPRSAAAGRAARAARRRAASAMAMISDASAMRGPRVAGPAMASQWAASARASTIGSPATAGRGPPPPRPGRGGGHRAPPARAPRTAGPAPWPAGPAPAGSLGEGPGGLLEQVDLALVEQAHLEARQVGAPAERGTGEELGRPARGPGRPARRRRGPRPPRRRRAAGPARARRGRRPGRSWPRAERERGKARS